LALAGHREDVVDFRFSMAARLDREIEALRECQTKRPDSQSAATRFAQAHRR